MTTTLNHEAFVKKLTAQLLYRLGQAAYAELVVIGGNEIPRAKKAEN